MGRPEEPVLEQDSAEPDGHGLESPSTDSQTNGDRLDRTSSASSSGIQVQVCSQVCEHASYQQNMHGHGSQPVLEQDSQEPDVHGVESPSTDWQMNIERLDCTSFASSSGTQIGGRMTTQCLCDAGSPAQRSMRETNMCHFTAVQVTSWACCGCKTTHRSGCFRQLISRGWLGQLNLVLSSVHALLVSVRHAAAQKPTG